MQFIGRNQSWVRPVPKGLGNHVGLLDPGSISVQATAAPGYTAGQAVCHYLDGVSAVAAAGP